MVPHANPQQGSSRNTSGFVSGSLQVLVRGTSSPSKAMTKPTSVNLLSWLSLNISDGISMILIGKASGWVHVSYC